jgi:hypothetical protein
MGLSSALDPLGRDCNVFQLRFTLVPLVHVYAGFQYDRILSVPVFCIYVLSSFPAETRGKGMCMDGVIMVFPFFGWFLDGEPFYNVKNM